MGHGIHSNILYGKAKNCTVRKNQQTQKQTASNQQQQQTSSSSVREELETSNYKEEQISPIQPLSEIVTIVMSKTPNTVAFDAPERSMNGDGDNSSYPLIAAVVVQDQATCSEEQTGSSQLVLNASDYLVSEHEDNDGVGTINKVDDDREELDRRISSKSRGQIIAACDHGAGNILTEDGNGSGPAEIPPETDDVEKSDVNDAKDEDEESDYSYDYEDDEDGQYSGFLMSTEPTYDTIQSGVTSVVPQEEKKHVVEDDEGKSSFEQITQFAPLKRTLDPVLDDKKSKWKEPTQEAVSMSLRAEREKSGGRRRLAADLYKVMITDTKEAGFIVEQKGDECMDKWAVKLFKFDEDSDLHKDLLVLGLDHVELEMNFPEQVC